MKKTVWGYSKEAVTPNGAAVSVWADQSGNANDGIPATCANQPIYAGPDGIVGGFASREVAVMAALRYFRPADGDTFFVWRGSTPDPTEFLPSAEALIEVIADDFCHDEPEQFLGAVDDDAKRELNALLYVWAIKHIAICTWTGPPEKYTWHPRNEMPGAEPKDPG